MPLRHSPFVPLALWIAAKLRVWSRKWALLWPFRPSFFCALWRSKTLMPHSTHPHTLPHTHTCIHLHGCLTGNWYLIKVQAQLLSVSRKTFPSAANRKLHSGKFSPPRGVTCPLSLFFYDILVLHGTHWICLKWALLSRWTWNKQVEGCVWCSQRMLCQSKL